MACRNRQRAEAARAKLLELFEDDVARFYLRRRGSKSDGDGVDHRAEDFRANLVVAVHLLDLASVWSTLAFADEVARTVTHVSPSMSCLLVGDWMGCADVLVRAGIHKFCTSYATPALHPS